MRIVRASEHGHTIYKRRRATVEPLFAQIKFNRENSLIVISQGVVARM